MSWELPPPRRPQQTTGEKVAIGCLGSLGCLYTLLYIAAIALVVIAGAIAIDKYLLT